jgi:hypothetical protein
MRHKGSAVVQRSLCVFGLTENDYINQKHSDTAYLIIDPGVRID